MDTHPTFTSESFSSEDMYFMDDFLEKSAQAAAAFQEDTTARKAMSDLAAAIVRAQLAGGRLLVAGNGGSAADAQHIAGEFTARMMYDRRPLAGIALTTDTSALTAIGNDYGYEHVFSRQIQGLGRPGDVFLGISTSGTSPNVLRAFEAAREGGLICAAFTGAKGMRFDCDITVAAPSDWTPVIQQVHIIAAHIVCALAERALCPVRP